MNVKIWRLRGKVLEPKSKRKFLSSNVEVKKPKGISTKFTKIRA